MRVFHGVVQVEPAMKGIMNQMDFVSHCEATFEKIWSGCPDKSKPYWNGTECTEAQPWTDNTDCKAGEYCDYNAYVNCRTGPTEKGTCKTADVASGTNGYGFTLSANKMDWFSAEKFCKALKKTMVSLEDTDCTTSTFDWSKTATGNLSSTYWWTKDLFSSSDCFAFVVRSDWQATDGNSRAQDSSNALCK